jgi:histidinol-phosphate aminotransferase
MLRARMSPSSPSLNPQLADLPVYVPGRPIEEVAREHGLDPAGVIKLASNENPLGPSPKAIDAMQRALRSLNLYPDGSAFYFKRRLAAALSVGEEHVVLGNGSNEILEFVGHAFLSPGSEVVVSEHCFAVYPIVSALFGAKLVTAPARDFGADISAILNAITPATRALFLANPNNPTGTLTASADVMRLIKEVPPRVLIVMDEAYIEFLEEALDLLPLICSGERPNLILARTFSKVYGLAGLRIGYGIGSPEVIRAMEKIRQPFNINSAAQSAALAAIDDSGHLAATRANNKAGLVYVHGVFAELGLTFVKSYANFVLVKVGNGARVFAELQRRGIIVRPMAGYGLPEWVRISVGTPDQNSRCAAALREILNPA